MTTNNKSLEIPRHNSAIDGLRTFAVLSVMVFHFGLPVYGGFIGVDAFFVLSGFLITLLLLRASSSSQGISLAVFWVRRIRRLIPAMLFMVAGVVIYATFEGSLPGKISLVSDVNSTLAYVANWHFISSSSYFANDDTVSPLLHMWSLAVEEQFYIIWPICIYLIAKFFNKRMAIIVFVLSITIAIGSSVWMAHLWDPASPERAYMGTDSRAFQLAIGSGLAALITLKPNLIGSRLSRATIGVVSLGALGVLALTLGTKSGPTNFYVSGGAFLVGIVSATSIWSLWSGQSLLSSIMTFKPLVYLGKLSYSMYLWHWPIEVYLHPRLPRFDNNNLISQTLILTLLTIAMAAISYHLVEMPMRTRGPLVKPKNWKILFGTPIVLLIMAITSTYFLSKPPATNPVNGNYKVIMLVGDSVPLRLSAEFDKYARSKGWNVINAAKGFCPATTRAMTDPDGAEFGNTGSCVAHEKTQLEVMEKYRPSAVIWMSRYELADAPTSAGVSLSPSSQEFWKFSSDSLSETVVTLTSQNADVVFVPIEPSGVGILDRCTPSDCNWFLERLISGEGVGYQEKWNQLLLDESMVNSKTHYFSISEFVCRDSNVPCDDSVGGNPARPDGTHYTPEGASQFIPKLVDFAISKSTE
jgi:peptidoglycan/LPS O-acetylase OafA/YrhL